MMDRLVVESIQQPREIENVQATPVRTALLVEQTVKSLDFETLQWWLAVVVTHS